MTKLKVRSYECDSYGHVNNAVYQNYLEYARMEALQEKGFTLNSMKEKGYLVVVRRTELDYLHPLYMNDHVNIRTFVSSAQNTSGTFTQQIFRDKDKKMCVEAKITWVFTNLQGRPIHIPAEIREAFEINENQKKVKNQYTHRVAVNAYLLSNSKFLLLKRNRKPYIWSPPGGRLKPDENPLDGLKRELKEETQLDVKIMAAVNTWFGDWNGSPVLSIDYLAEVIHGTIKLSNEHTDYKWVTLKELRAGYPLGLDSEQGFKLQDFENAQKLYDLLY